MNIEDEPIGDDDDIAPTQTPLRLGAGIHDIAFADYLADPCEEPSLRSGDIQRLLTATPRHFIANHPRLSPNPPRINSDRMDLGSIVHQMVLGKGDEIVQCNFKDWKTQKSRDERDAARAAGKIPALPKTMERAAQIAIATVTSLKAEFGEWPFGDTEQTFIWSEEVATRDGDVVKVWCRSRPDINDLVVRALVVDLKSTEIVLSDDGVEGRLTDSDGRTLIQAAWQLRGAMALRPDLAGRLSHAHAFVETRAPFEPRVNDTPSGDLEIAYRRCTRAMELYAGMKAEHKNAPGWPRRRLGMREWLMKKWIAEEEGAMS